MDWINQSHLKYQARRIHGTGGLFRWGSYQAHFDLSHEDNSPVHTHWMISTTLKPLWKWMRLCISRGLSINTLLRVRRYLRGTPFAVPRWTQDARATGCFTKGQTIARSATTAIVSSTAASVWESIGLTCTGHDGPLEKSYSVGCLHSKEVQSIYIWEFVNVFDFNLMLYTFLYISCIRCTVFFWYLYEI